MGKWISLNEFMQKYKVGYEVALQMLDSGQYQYKKTDGGRYKILVDADVVSRAEYEKVVQECEKYKTIVNSALAVLTI